MQLFSQFLGADKAASGRSKHVVALVGDAGKSLVLAMVSIFFVLLILHEFNVIDVFSNLYQNEGFCVAAITSSPWLRGHALSFYACCLMAAWMRLMVSFGDHCGMSSESLKPIKKNSISLFGHSLGHAFLAYNTNNLSGGTRVFEDLSFTGRMVTFVVLQFVWYGFMRQRNSKRSHLTAFSLALFHNSLQTFILPSRWFFTHVLIAVLTSSALRGIGRDPKDKTIYYALEAWFVDVNILVMTFVEAFTCESFLMHIGGHVWFDMVVPVGFTVYFFLLFESHTEKRLDKSVASAFKNYVFGNKTKKVAPTSPKVAVDGLKFRW